jgi:hypothetical protein
MMILQKKNPDNLLQKSLFLGVLIAIVLIIFGWILIPSTRLLSIGGAFLVLGIYSFVFYFGVPKFSSEIIRWGGIFGLAAGIIFAGEIILEYVFLPKDNSIWGLIEFGSVFFLYFLCGLWAVYQNGRMRSGMVSAVLSAMISTLIWLIVILIIFYVFRETDRQTQVFMAEGNFEDFARSGAADFNTFIMEDFLGAAFFHLFLGPLMAFILGTIGGLFGKGSARLKKHGTDFPITG